ncbi:hypothetical protein IE81DRAFT_348993 [Ceraceosorus guamensis]|uniref:Uncharacterized protein n=1 Tax=Ceraceosorus guamensis TaxID=1522189 RepID=A0A316VUW9_9BASI|nr:hypothetical protein IE81DRAFT_348993 [Ceraceosorus guamensis]PWN40698.1 hypothetical protein IE81DRAFT_348993 [Ceraceosorus guamensis]
MTLLEVIRHKKPSASNSRRDSAGHSLASQRALPPLSHSQGTTPASSSPNSRRSSYDCGCAQDSPIPGAYVVHSPTCDSHHQSGVASHGPDFSRLRKYRGPNTSAGACAVYHSEPVGSPRTSEEVKNAYLASQATSANRNHHHGHSPNLAMTPLPEPHGGANRIQAQAH